MSKYPKELHKDSIKWLRTYGYTLNSEHEDYKKLKMILKEHYPFHYYMWVDLDIKREAEKITPTNEGYWGTKFTASRRKLVKEKYGLVK